MIAPLGAAASEFLPPRAVYDLRLAEPRRGQGSSGLDGRLVLELAATCDDYLLNQRMLTRLMGQGGAPRVSDFRVAISESRSGQRMRFAIQNYVNGTLVQERDGTAALEGPGAAGTVRFAKPEQPDERLPAGTVFPVDFNNQLLAAAVGDARQLQVSVFDGSNEGVYDAVSFISPRRRDEPRQGPARSALAGIPSWTVQTAYFPLLGGAETPEFEVSFRLFANGVSDEVILDYGDLRLAGELVDLTVLSVPDCG